MIIYYNCNNIQRIIIYTQNAYLEHLTLCMESSVESALFSCVMKKLKQKLLDWLQPAVDCLEKLPYHCQAYPTAAPMKAAVASDYE